MTKIATFEAAGVVEVPGQHLLKEAVDPVLSGMPVWLSAVVWAVLVMTLLYVVLIWALRSVLPWISSVLTPVTRTAIELVGVTFLLPAYGVNTLVRRARGGVPAVMFVYDDFVHGATKAGHWTAAAVLKVPAGLRKMSALGVAVVLLVMAGLWDITYCTGAGPGCTLPTSQWITSVSHAFVRSTPTPAPGSKKTHGAGHKKKCTSSHKPGCKKAG